MEEVDSMTPDLDKDRISFLLGVIRKARIVLQRPDDDYKCERAEGILMVGELAKGDE